MTTEAGFVASRFLHDLALLLGFGAALFPFYTWRATEPVPDIVERYIRVAVPAAALLAIVSGAAWFVFTVNTMADSASGFLDRDTVQYVLSDTDFGKLWVGRAAVALALGGLAISRIRYTRSARSFGLVALSGVLLLTLAGTGHTQSAAGTTKLLQEGADAMHLLAAGAWLGGLVPLAIVAKGGGHQEATTALTRFSGVGYVAVTLLLTTGLVDGVILVGSLGGLFASPYGQVLLIKVALFLAMVALAAANRFLLVPSLAHGQSVKSALSRLRRHILLEQILGVAVIAAVSVLGTLAPPAMH